MQVHANAKLVPSARLLLVRRVLEERWRIAEVAAAFGVSERTAYRWLARWRAGDRELLDRSSVPKHSPRRTPRVVEVLIEQLRRLRMTSTRIAAELEMAVSTVGVVLKRLGLNRLSRLEPPEPPNRYERRRPGELIHVDIKKLGRFRRAGHRVTGRAVPGAHAGKGRQGWDCVHVAIDDYSRVAYVEVLPDETAATCIAFLDRAIDWFAERAVRVERVMSDNGSGYVSRAFAAACARHRIRHLRTRPYRPRTNGKAERFIQTLQREWAYAVRYETSDHRTLALGPWIEYYNRRRPHSALGHRAPATRLPAA
ncbi:MAG: IS481 family transposase [Acidimicrobiia bacterium]